MRVFSFIRKNFHTFCLFFLTTSLYASTPLWTYTPLTDTAFDLPANETRIVQYLITNQADVNFTLELMPIQGVSQVTDGLGICSHPLVLKGKGTCILSLEFNGSKLNGPIIGGPKTCRGGNRLQCYTPPTANQLRITPSDAIGDAIIIVVDSPLTLTANGPEGTLTIRNTSLDVTATNITSDFTGTALEGNVTETGSTCKSLAPLTNCKLSYTPGSNIVPRTNFTIQGDNTNALTAAIKIDEEIVVDSVTPNSGLSIGGTEVTIKGSGFSGVRWVNFGGNPATRVVQVDSTTITAVTPDHAAGLVDVQVVVAGGSSGTKADAFTYIQAVVGEPAYGGIIGCINGGLNNLIVAPTDISTGAEWGNSGTYAGATSITNGRKNTIEITTEHAAPGIAACLCAAYSIDSEGNSPCQSGNVCYNDWFLVAGNNTTSTGQLNCLYINRSAIDNFASDIYWSSTEVISDNAYAQSFANGAESAPARTTMQHVRCARAPGPPDPWDSFC